MDQEIETFLGAPTKADRAIEPCQPPPGFRSPGGASDLCAVAEPRDGPAGRELAPGVPAGHFRRLPPARRLHIDNGGPGRCERLRGADPERMPRNAALDPSIRRTRRNIGPARWPAASR